MLPGNDNKFLFSVQAFPTLEDEYFSPFPVFLNLHVLSNPLPANRDK